MKILVLRPREYVSETLKLFRDEGFEVYFCPIIELEYVDFDVPEHDIAIVMSQNAARQIVKKEIKLKKVIAIGKKTANLLKTHGYDAITPSKFDSKSLVREFFNILKNKRVVIFKSDAKNEEFEKLKEFADVKEIIVYKIKPLKGKDQISVIKNLQDFDVIIFSSSIIAKTFLELCDIEVLKNKICIAIGPSTAEVLKNYGIKPLIPDEYTFNGILRLIKDLKEKED